MEKARDAAGASRGASRGASSLLDAPKSLLHRYGLTSGQARATSEPLPDMAPEPRYELPRATPRRPPLPPPSSQELAPRTSAGPGLPAAAPGSACDGATALAGFPKLPRVPSRPAPQARRFPALGASPLGADFRGEGAWASASGSHWGSCSVLAEVRCEDHVGLSWSLAGAPTHCNEGRTSPRPLRDACRGPRGPRGGAEHSAQSRGGPESALFFTTSAHEPVVRAHVGAKGRCAHVTPVTSPTSSSADAWAPSTTSQAENGTPSARTPAWVLIGPGLIPPLSLLPSDGSGHAPGIPCRRHSPPGEPQQRLLPTQPQTAGLASSMPVLQDGHGGRGADPRPTPEFWATPASSCRAALPPARVGPLSLSLAPLP